MSGHLALYKNGSIDVDDSVAHGESAVIPTHVSSCEGILYSDVTSIFFPPTYDFLRCYPIGIHSPVVQEQFKEYNGLLVPDARSSKSGTIGREQDMLMFFNGTPTLSVTS